MKMQDQDKEKNNFKPTKEQNVNSRSLNAKSNREMRAWKHNISKLTDDDKRFILARVIQVAVMILTSTHAYTFAGRLYKQKAGAPIGLRASACLAKIIMSMWDRRWAIIQNKFKLKVYIFFMYVDDIRILMRPLTPG